MMKNLFLSDIMELYEACLQTQHPAKKAKEIIDHTKTAINRYTLPGWGLKPFKSRRPTQLEIDGATTFKKGINVEKFTTALEAQEKAFELLQPSDSSKEVYSSRLKALISWCEKQSWWPGNTDPDKVIDRCPARHQKYGPMQKNLVVNRPKLKPYGLIAEQISETLKAETELFRQFRTEIHWPNRLDESIKSSVAHDEITVIFQILGWFHHHRGVLLDDLNLNTLIPWVKLKYATCKEDAARMAAQAGDYVDRWICEFRNFLIKERDAKSPHTHQCYLKAILAVAKFQYYEELTSSDYSEVPAVKVVQKRLTLINKEFKNYVSAVDMDKKWLDLPELLKLIVERLRLECQPKSACGSVRAGTATASSFQRYILWGCLTYSPPRRQQELRGLKIGLECLIDRPEGVPANGLYHPLPPIQKRDRNYSCLHKTPDGRWFRDTPAESYKTGKTYGHQELEIPNVPFDDGKFFYDYLEAWLYGCPKKSNGNPKKKKKSDGNPKKWKTPNEWWHSCGRSDFNPNHEFVFVQHNGKPFAHQGMYQYLSAAAHAFTGQRVGPHLVRDIFATYFLNEGAPESDVASLAYAMGHSPEMLRKNYDKRTPNQKHKPIQLALSKVVQESL